MYICRRLYSSTDDEPSFACLTPSLRCLLRQVLHGLIFIIIIYLNLGTIENQKSDFVNPFVMQYSCKAR
jgi:hypothetical protein